ncbi:hypothetical protein BD414DRAFT_578527 [Trametes punicea]|nr:hypothetical protein BD414DRAFT_578527 [Trametes punicea]
MTPHASLQRLLGDKLALYISVADWGRDYNKVFGGKTAQRGTKTRRKRPSSSETQPRGEETTAPEADHGAVRQSPPATSPSIAHSARERTSPSAQVPPDRVLEGQDRIQPAQAQLTVEEHATSYPTMRQEMYRQYSPCYTPESQLPITGLAAQPIHLHQPSQLPAASALSIHPLAGYAPHMHPATGSLPNWSAWCAGYATPTWPVATSSSLERPDPVVQPDDLYGSNARRVEQAGHAADRSVEDALEPSSLHYSSCAAFETPSLHRHTRIKYNRTAQIAQSGTVSNQAFTLLPEAASADPTDLAISVMASAGYVQYPVDLAEPGMTAPAHSHAQPDWPWQTWDVPQATTDTPRTLRMRGHSGPLRALVPYAHDWK